MINLRIIRAFSIGMAVLTSLCFGQNDSTFSIKPNGYASLEAGQIVKGFDKNVTDNIRGVINNVWTEKIYTGFGLDARFGPRTKLISGVGVKTFNEYPRLLKPGSSRRFYYYLFLTQAELTHTLFDDSKWKLNVGGGYFPYKYDDCVRNLGEYLFRSTTYPQTLTTEFDYPFARLAGVYAKGEYSDGINTLNLDLLLTTNTEWIAIHDLNLSLLAKYNLAQVLEIGAGVEFCSILSADETATTPKDNSTIYAIDSSANGIKDTSYYTFRGQKVMARASIDPKKFFHSTIFGDQDLKLYGEAALLGVKNYPAALHSPIWYNSILERIPLMVGFNFPAFKILDILSLEYEWWGNRYPNSMEGIVRNGLPIPFEPPGPPEIDSTKYKNDNVKWSIYASRTFAKHYRITFQVANDHIRTFAWDWDRQDWEESLRGPDCWYYVLKFGVMF